MAGVASNRSQGQIIITHASAQLFEYLTSTVWGVVGEGGGKIEWTQFLLCG